MWGGGQRVHLIIPESGTEAMRFLLNRIMPRMDEADLSRFYLQRIYQQKIQSMPSQMRCASAIAEVRHDPNAIALVPRVSIFDARSVHVIRID